MGHDMPETYAKKSMSVKQWSRYELWRFIMLRLVGCKKILMWSWLLG